MTDGEESPTPSPQRRAWMALAYPVLCWLSGYVLALLQPRLGPAGWMVVTGIQAFLLFAGLFVGASALRNRGAGGPAIILPASLGIMLSAATLLLIVLTMSGAIRL